MTHTDLLDDDGHVSYVGSKPQGLLIGLASTRHIWIKRVAGKPAFLSDIDTARFFCLSTTGRTPSGTPVFFTIVHPPLHRRISTGILHDRWLPSPKYLHVARALS